MSNPFQLLHVSIFLNFKPLIEKSDFATIEIFPE